MVGGLDLYQGWNRLRDFCFASIPIGSSAKQKWARNCTPTVERPGEWENWTLKSLRLHTICGCLNVISRNHSFSSSWSDMSFECVKIPLGLSYELVEMFPYRWWCGAARLNFLEPGINGMFFFLQRVLSTNSKKSGMERNGMLFERLFTKYLEVGNSEGSWEFMFVSLISLKEFRRVYCSVNLHFLL